MDLGIWLPIFKDLKCTFCAIYVIEEPESFTYDCPLRRVDSD